MSDVRCPAPVDGGLEGSTGGGFGILINLLSSASAVCRID